MSSCGSRSNPWRVEASTGQRIDIGLLDFTASSNASRAQYGYVIEKTNKKNVSIGSSTAVGGAKRPRDSAVYTSDTNSLDIVLSGTATDNYNLLISLQGDVGLMQKQIRLTSVKSLDCKITVHKINLFNFFRLINFLHFTPLFVFTSSRYHIIFKLFRHLILFLWSKC